MPNSGLVRALLAKNDPEDFLAPAASAGIPLGLDVDHSHAWGVAVPSGARAARVEIRITTRRRWLREAASRVPGWRTLPVPPLVVAWRVAFEVSSQTELN